MGQNIIRVLVVDDSSVVREVISDIINGTPDMEVVATAEDGIEALELFEKTNPDVVTLDVQMPRMDGLETLDALLRIRPVAVIMLSYLTSEDTETTLEALNRGAINYIAKPSDTHDGITCLQEQLLRKIRKAACSDLKSVMEIGNFVDKVKRFNPISDTGQ